MTAILVVIAAVVFVTVRPVPSSLPGYWPLVPSSLPGYWPLVLPGVVILLKASHGSVLRRVRYRRA
ncbi:hypothetical protein [Streptomyces eurythermus]